MEVYINGIITSTGEQVVKKRGSKSASIEKTTTATKDEIKQILNNSLYWYKRNSCDECRTPWWLAETAKSLENAGDG